MYFGNGVNAKLYNRDFFVSRNGPLQVQKELQGVKSQAQMALAPRRWSVGGPRQRARVRWRPRNADHLRASV